MNDLGLPQVFSIVGVEKVTELMAWPPRINGLISNEPQTSGFIRPIQKAWPHPKALELGPQAN